MATLAKTKTSANLPSLATRSQMSIPAAPHTYGRITKEKQKQYLEKQQQ